MDRMTEARASINIHASGSCASRLVLARSLGGRRHFVDQLGPATTARYDCVQAHRARPGADPQSAPAHRRTGLLADGTVDCAACVQAILVDADARAGTPIRRTPLTRR